MGESARDSLTITVTVIRSLMLREALSRLFGGRAAWLWVFTEPVWHAVFLMLLFSAVRVRHVGGFEMPMWILVGLIAWFLFDRTGKESAAAIGANRTLLTYRQVKPVDLVLARGLLEGALMIVVAVLLLCGAALVGYRVWPARVLDVILAGVGMWCVGAGWGFCVSVASELAPEIGRILRIAIRPLYLLSGVMFPLGSVPPQWREVLMLNPLVHGIEAMRVAFAPFYHVAPGISLLYLYAAALLLVWIGLMLQVGLSSRLAAL